MVGVAHDLAARAPQIDPDSIEDADWVEDQLAIGDAQPGLICFEGAIGRLRSRAPPAISHDPAGWCRWRRRAAPSAGSCSRSASSTPDSALTASIRPVDAPQEDPVVRALYTAIDKVFAPIVADEERRANSRVIRPTNALRGPAIRSGCAL